MITEFVGPPGSGKSTVARRFAESDGGDVLKLNGYSPDATVGRVRSVLEQPVLIGATAIIDHRPAVNLARRNHLMRHLPRGRVWIEDGPLFALSRMVTTSKRTDTKHIARVLKHLSLPERCIVVKTSPETCLFRLRNLRGGNNQIAKMPERQAIEYLHAFYAAIDLVLCCLPPRIDVVHLHNDQPS